MWLVLPYNVDRARRGVKTCSCESLTLLPEHIWALMRHRLFYRPLEKEEDAIWHERATNATAFLHSIQRGADICAPWTRTKLIICHLPWPQYTVTSLGLAPLSGQDSEGDLIFGWAQLLPTNQKRITAHNMKMAKIAPTHAYRPCQW